MEMTPQEAAGRLPVRSEGLVSLTHNTKNQGPYSQN